VTGRVLVVQHEDGTDAGRVGQWLGEAGVALDVRRPDRGDRLPGPYDGDGAAYDGLLVLGGAMGPADDEACPWLPAVRALLVDAVDAGLPTLGICLGAELLAVACGGSVRRGVAGPELGVLDCEPTAAAADDPLFGALPARARVVQWHWEEIADLPPGAVRLASSAMYENQAFRLGDRAWAVQGHPEVTGEIAAIWARDDSPLLKAAGRDPNELVSEVAAAQAELTEAWRPVAHAFAASLAH
jgi:GMP synthase (glutamine-hydrolysing)